MLPYEEKKAYVVREVSLCHDPEVIHELFCRLLKSNKKYYQCVRACWLRQRQLSLFVKGQDARQ